MRKDSELPRFFEPRNAGISSKAFYYSTLFYSDEKLGSKRQCLSARNLSSSPNFRFGIAYMKASSSYILLCNTRFNSRMKLFP